MPKTTAPYVIFYISVDNTLEKPALCHEVIGEEKEARTRYGELAKDHDEITVWHKDRVINAEVDTTPRVVFHAHPALDAKPAVKRKPRRSRAEMQEFRANEAKKKNGAAESVTS